MFGNFLSCSGPPGAKQGAPGASGGEGRGQEGTHCSPSSQRSLASAALALQTPPSSSSSGICLKSWVRNVEWEWGRRGGKGQTDIPARHAVKSSGQEEPGHQAPPEPLAVPGSAPRGRWHRDTDTRPSLSRYFCCPRISSELLVAAQLPRPSPCSPRGFHLAQVTQTPGARVTHTVHSECLTLRVTNERGFRL